MLLLHLRTQLSMAVCQTRTFAYFWKINVNRCGCVPAGFGVVNTCRHGRPSGEVTPRLAVAGGEDCLVGLELRFLCLLAALIFPVGRCRRLVPGGVRTLD